MSLKFVSTIILLLMLYYSVFSNDKEKKLPENNETFNLINVIDYNSKNIYSRLAYSIDLNNLPTRDVRLRKNIFSFIYSIGI